MMSQGGEHQSSQVLNLRRRSDKQKEAHTWRRRASNVKHGSRSIDGPACDTTCCVFAGLEQLATEANHGGERSAALLLQITEI